MKTIKCDIVLYIYSFVIQQFAKLDKIFLDFLLAGMKKAVILQRQ